MVFDVGECLVDETREYGTWADWLGVPRHTFAAQFGAVIARGLDYRETFQVFRPGFDLDAERERRAAAGQPEWFGEEDLYPDVRPALARLREAGLWLGIAGNQTVRAGGILRELFADDVDLIGTSDDWGASKPDPTFFERVAEVVPVPPVETLYVGDRLDNDIRPAAEAGLRRRGHYRLDLARAHLWSGHRDRALAELERAEATAPQLIRNHPIARATLRRIRRAEHAAGAERLRRMSTRFRLED